MSPTLLPYYFGLDRPDAQPAVLHPTQLWLQSHIWWVDAFWWLTYTAVLAYVASRFVLLPLLARLRKTPASRSRRR